MRIIWWQKALNNHWLTLKVKPLVYLGLLKAKVQFVQYEGLIGVGTYAADVHHAMHSTKLVSFIVVKQMCMGIFYANVSMHQDEIESRLNFRFYSLILLYVYFFALCCPSTKTVLRPNSVAEFILPRLEKALWHMWILNAQRLYLEILTNENRYPTKHKKVISRPAIILPGATIFGAYIPPTWWQWKSTIRRTTVPSGRWGWR